MNEQFMCERVPTLKEYRAQVGGAVCRWDGTKLAEDVDTYPHHGGWRVDGMVEKQWLSIQCPRCKYDWSLDKLGVPRP